MFIYLCIYLYIYIEYFIIHLFKNIKSYIPCNSNIIASWGIAIGVVVAWELYDRQLKPVQVTNNIKIDAISDNKKP